MIYDFAYETLLNFEDFKLNNHVFSGVYIFDFDLLLPTSNQSLFRLYQVWNKVLEK